MSKTMLTTRPVLACLAALSAAALLGLLALMTLAPISPAEARSSRSKAAAEAEPTGPILINTATEAELRRVKGIGPVMARRILEARQAGPFLSPEDLSRRVKGIGEKTLQKLLVRGLRVPVRTLPEPVRPEGPGSDRPQPLPQASRPRPIAPPAAPRAAR